MEKQEDLTETTKEEVVTESENAVESKAISQIQADSKESQEKSESIAEGQNEEDMKETKEREGDEDSEKPLIDEDATGRKEEVTSEEPPDPVKEKGHEGLVSKEVSQVPKENEEGDMETTETGEEAGTGTEDKDQSSSDTPKNPSEKDESKQTSLSSHASSREGAEKKPLSGSGGDRERKRDRKKKRQKSVPKLLRKTSKTGHAAEQYLQTILLSYFQASDPMNSRLITQEDFWTILLSPELNLQLNNVDIQILQDSIQTDAQGLIPYMDFVGMAQQLITTVYHGQPISQSNWVELRGADGTIVNYNKKTGEIIDDAESGMDLFEETMKDLFQAADTENKGHVTAEQFRKMLEAKEMSLKPEEKEELVKTFPEGEVRYSDFQPIAKEMILKIYRARDDSGNEWIQMSSPMVGWFFLNKLTGETRRNLGITEEREQEAALINQAYSQIDSLNLQLEQEGVHTRELENQVAIANEELEATAAQLDETGRQLDDVNLELQLKETEVFQLQSIIKEKDEYITELNAQVAEVTALQDHLAQTQSELEEMKRLLQERDTMLAGKDQTMEDLKLQSDAITEELKNAHGVIDARESSIDSLQYNLSNEQGRVKHLKQQMPSLETRLSLMMNELSTAQHGLEEKSATLLQTRKSLRIAREKNSELEKEVFKLSQVNDKLKNAECEIKTLKSFLTSKTAMVERRKKEIQELKLKISEIESRDNRRAIILADVLEKTARSYQQKLISPKLQTFAETETTDGAPPTCRPLSAPIVPLEEVLDPSYDADPLSLSYQSPPTRGRRLTTDQYQVPPAGKTIGRGPRKRGHIKARTVPRLPPIRKQKSDFVIPTQHEISKYNRYRDVKIHPHTSSVNCRCEMCALNRRSPAAMGYSVSDGGVALSRLRLETDQREYQLSKQLKIGQRVVIQIKKSMYDLEPQKLTGIVKYIGKIDSEFVDNRIYVGVKLDDPVGNCDGMYKGKRYFTCPPSHGRMVQITNVISVMPNKSVVYKPLQIGPQSITSSNNDSPYMNSTMLQLQQKRSPLRVA